MTHYYPDYFYLNDFKKKVKGQKVTIKGLKYININIIIFIVVALIVILLLLIFIGIPLYFNDDFKSTISHLFIIRNCILPLIIVMVLFFKLINIRNRFDFIVFINSLFTLLGFTIEFSTFSGLYSFYSTKQVAGGLDLNISYNFNKFIKDFIDYKGLNLKHRMPLVWSILPLNCSPKFIGKSYGSLFQPNTLPRVLPSISKSKLNQIFSSPVLNNILNNDYSETEVGSYRDCETVVGSDWDSETVVVSQSNHDLKIEDFSKASVKSKDRDRQCYFSREYLAENSVQRVLVNTINGRELFTPTAAADVGHDRCYSSSA